ncbi:MAG TPA: hypothetical protein VGF82_25790 [Terracidiphilus sp.]
MEQYYASDRLHGFVRALEALILPEAGKTEKQFISRCGLFAGPKSGETTVRNALQEAYKMRCDIEHVHDWDRSLQVYPSAGREDQALWRTRQMEALACGIYKGILLEPILQAEFCSDASLKAFWQKPEDVIRATLGNICDITQMKVVKQYDSFGRAGTSNWPEGWGENLRRKADVSLSSTSPTLGLN